MKLSDFQIGIEFMNDGARWRCTDVGTRVVIAICIDEDSIASRNDDEPIEAGTISERAVHETSVFRGPPYDVSEYVFDEDDRSRCAPAGHTGSTDRL